MKLNIIKKESDLKAGLLYFRLGVSDTGSIIMEKAKILGRVKHGEYNYCNGTLVLTVTKGYLGSTHKSEGYVSDFLGHSGQRFYTLHEIEEERILSSFFAVRWSNKLQTFLNRLNTEQLRGFILTGSPVELPEKLLKLANEKYRDKFNSLHFLDFDGDVLN